MSDDCRHRDFSIVAETNVFRNRVAEYRDGLNAELSLVVGILNESPCQSRLRCRQGKQLFARSRRHDLFGHASLLAQDGVSLILYDPAALEFLEPWPERSPLQFIGGLHKLAHRHIFFDARKKNRQPFANCESPGFGANFWAFEADQHFARADKSYHVKILRWAFL